MPPKLEQATSSQDSGKSESGSYITFLDKLGLSKGLFDSCPVKAKEIIGDKLEKEQTILEAKLIGLGVSGEIIEDVYKNSEEFVKKAKVVSDDAERGTEVKVTEWAFTHIQSDYMNNLDILVKRANAPHPINIYGDRANDTRTVIKEGMYFYSKGVEQGEAIKLAPNNYLEDMVDNIEDEPGDIFHFPKIVNRLKEEVPPQSPILK